MMQQHQFNGDSNEWNALCIDMHNAHKWSLNAFVLTPQHSALFNCSTVDCVPRAYTRIWLCWSYACVTHTSCSHSVWFCNGTAVLHMQTLHCSALALHCQLAAQLEIKVRNRSGSLFAVPISICIYSLRNDSFFMRDFLSLFCLCSLCGTHLEWFIVNELSIFQQKSRKKISKNRRTKDRD